MTIFKALLLLNYYYLIKRLVAIQTRAFNLNLTELKNVCTSTEQSRKSSLFAFHLYAGSH